MTISGAGRVRGRVAVIRSAIHGVGVFALSSAPKDQVLFRTTTYAVLATPRAGSVQRSPHEHIIENEVLLFVNHSCKPSARVEFHRDSICLTANRAIQAGEELTCDYRLTESLVPCPFECRCGSCSPPATIEGSNA